MKAKHLIVNIQWKMEENSANNSENIDKACLICNEQEATKHYGAQSCHGCKVNHLRIWFFIYYSFICLFIIFRISSADP